MGHWQPKGWMIGILIGFLIAGCTLRLGGPSRLPAAPAPTAIALPATAYPYKDGQGLMPPQPLGVPPGFAIAVFAEGLNGPRMLAVRPDGALCAAERGAGRVVCLPDADGNGVADSVQVIADQLEAPSSLAFYRDGSLYVAETQRILRLPAPSGEEMYGPPETIVDGLPSGGHSTRTVLFSPDWQWLYVSIGSSCNVCLEQDSRRAAIVRYRPDGSNQEIYASGLRNAVGITFRPGSQELWATNNGRDWLGDNLPPETVNLVQAGDDFGWPRCHAGRIVDPEFGSPTACEDVADPQVEIQAHSAPLGLAFYSGSQFPELYQGELFVAYHGSWNRSIPTGYKVVRIPLGNGQPGAVEDFAVGWLEAGESAWGRPVDVITGADGNLYVSDDSSGRIYRIFYIGE